MGKKVIVAGNVCLDITPKFLGGKFANINDVLEPGKLVEMGGVTLSSGGVVSNTGLGMKLLGADVILMGKLGNDAFGNMLIDIFSKKGAAEGLIVREDAATSYSIVLAIPGIDRIFLHSPAVNNEFYADDLSDETLKKANLFHFGYPTIMRSMYIDNGKELVDMLTKVKKAGCAVSLDMAAIDPNSEAAKVDWKRILKNTIPLIDFFVPSIEELCYMLDRKRYEEWKRRAVGRDITSFISLEEDIRPLADKCFELGAKVLLLKCGEKGMYLRSAGKEKIEGISDRLALDKSAWADIDIFEKSFVPDKVASATGAGDTSIAAFLTSILNEESPHMCLKLAAATGACCVSEYDALSGLKPLEELKERISRGWAKIE